MDPGEQHLSGAVEARFQDPETGQSVILRPPGLGRAYDRTVRKAMPRWRLGLRRHGIAYRKVVTTDTPFGTALRQALVRRDVGRMISFAAPWVLAGLAAALVPFCSISSRGGSRPSSSFPPSGT